MAESADSGRLSTGMSSCSGSSGPQYPGEIFGVKVVETLTWGWWEPWWDTVTPLREGMFNIGPGREEPVVRRAGRLGRIGPVGRLLLLLLLAWEDCRLSGAGLETGRPPKPEEKLAWEVAMAMAWLWAWDCP